MRTRFGRSLLLAAGALSACSGEAPDPVPPAPAESTAARQPRSSPPTEITWDTARTAPVEDLVRLAFLPTGEDLVEVSRPGPPLPLSEEHVPVARLYFATRARHAGDYGLCEATVVEVPVNRTAETPRYPIVAYPVYKVVGDTGRDAGPDWTDAYERQLDERCARAGRVLGTNEDYYSGERFFRADVAEDHQLRFATKALQNAISRARLAPWSVACAETSEHEDLNCAWPARRFASLKIGELTYVSMRPCISRPDWQCVEAEFLGDWMVTLQSQIPDMHIGTDAGPLDKVTISYHATIS